MTRRQNLLADIAIVILFAGLTASVLGFRFLNSPNTPTGGDTASHVLYAYEYSRNLLFSGKILPWMPEVYAGFPFLSYYFPLPFIVIAALSKAIGFAPAFKWGSFIAALLLPGLIHVTGRRWFKLPWPAAVLGGVGAFAFLLHEQNSIWGGNLLSIMSGEFAYSYGLLFAVLACFAWVRASEVRGGWIIAALLEAATGFSHGFPLLVVGFSTVLLLTERGNLRQTVWMLLKGHLLAFCLLGGWLWPMLEMHGYTIPNDASFPLSSWNDLFPFALRPVFLTGAAALLTCLFTKSLRETVTPLQARAIRYMLGTAALGCLGFVAGDQIGLANIRFFPMVWLFCAVVSGWLVGLVVTGLICPSSALTGTFSLREKESSFPTWHLHPDGEENALTLAHRERVAAGRVRGKAVQLMLTLALIFGMLGGLTQTVHNAPHWSLWNHSGLEAKPQWHNLSQLFPAMNGSLWSPRLLFEHDPANNDLGSTRTLEALSMFIGGRPVLEGLYMESALLGPAIYQLQSEVSTRPSSPLARFPSGSLDFAFAAEHMRFLHADTVLLRSAAAQKAIEESGLFVKIATSPPFALYRLRDFSSRLAEVVTGPITVRPLKGWMEDSFSWFRTRSKFRGALPVYGTAAAPPAMPTKGSVRVKQLDREQLHFETDAIGAPHLIKVAWHPRWQLRSAGTLALAGPGFMLVTPQERDIILEFGHTRIGYAGMAATYVSFVVILIVFSGARSASCKTSKSPLIRPVGHLLPNGEGITSCLLTLGEGGQRSDEGIRQGVQVRRNYLKQLPVFLYWGAITLSCLWFATQSPEKVYMRGHTELQAGRNAEAADLFRRAYSRRRQPAKKEEALFWLAKATELSGKKAEAARHYLELADKYHGYWVPESLYRYIQLVAASGDTTRVNACVKRLEEEYPSNNWTEMLKEK